jgi:hypothetical protein
MKGMRLPVSGFYKLPGLAVMAMVTRAYGA